MNHNGIETERPSAEDGSPRCIQFGVFELRLDTAELTKHGVKVRLQSKPFQILQALLERPGRVVTREELHGRLWSGDRSVDYESSLNTAANRLRITLGDSADNPRYVETLPRIGYRFIAPINELAEPPMMNRAAAGAPVEETAAAVKPEPVAAVIHPPARRTAGIKLSRPALPIAMAVAAALVLLGFWSFRSHQNPVELHQVTFRHDLVSAARFGADGVSVLYSASLNGAPARIFTTSFVSPESRELGFPGATLAAVSTKGELALIALPSLNLPFGPLLRVRENGGAPLEVANKVYAADWLPGGNTLAVVRPDSRHWVVEFPIGKTLYSSDTWLSHIRVSPHGDAVAVVEHPTLGDDGGGIRVIYRDGSSQSLTTGWSSVWGLAWSPSGSEIWFTAARVGINRTPHAVSLAGKVRQIAQTPGTMTLEDVSPTGRVLVSHGDQRMMMTSASLSGDSEKDLSWFDQTDAVDVSRDGGAILFDESGEGGGPGYSAYLYRGANKGVVRLGEGRGMALSPDGKFAITAGQMDETLLKVSPIEAGPARTIANPGMKYYWVKFFSDGKRLLIGGSIKGGPSRLFTQNVDGTNLRPVEPSIWFPAAAISADGGRVAGTSSSGDLILSDLEHPPTKVPMGIRALALTWSGDQRSVFVVSLEQKPKIFQVDVKSGASKVVGNIAPADPSGLVVPTSIRLLGDKDKERVIYSYVRKLSQVYVVDGWR